MQIVDADIILRYLLKDIEELHTKAVQIIDNKQIHIPFEVIAEVFYVFEKIYEVPRSEIKEALSTLLNYPNISTLNINILNEALKIYEKQKIDFVDSLLVAYNHIQKDTIYSFDKKLNKLLLGQ
ncbi:MAG: PIN domain-containing protein [Bacteroidales bacterium]|nr:PIN domain-containing protein [Bacteroidales bacterium]